MSTKDTGGEELAVRFDPKAGPVDGGFEVGKLRFIVGSDEDCDFVIHDPEISGEHLSLKMLDGHVEVHDLGSRTGTFVNGSRITAPTLVEPGDELKLGNSVLKAQLVEPEVAPPAPAPGRGGGEGPPPVQPSRPPGGRRPSRLVVTIGAVAVGLVALVAILAVAGVFSGGGGALSEQEVIAKDKPATLMVITREKTASPLTTIFGNGGTLLAGGTAWVYDASKGLIVTNAHVVVNGDTFEAGYDSTNLVHATLVGVDLPDDIAVLRLPPALLSGLTTMERATAADVKQGDTVYALGFPGNSTSEIDFLKTPFQATSGTISATSGVSATVNTDALGEPENENAGVLHSDLYQTDAAVNPGNSGGPLVNDHGELVGMNEAASGSTQNQGYAIPVSKLNEVLPQLAKGESIGWPGFGTTALSPSDAEYLGGEGLIMTAVAKDTPADQEGLGRYLAEASKFGNFVI
ncbi:MAG TPA: trypsin-like peptidase domain-containing protein, partial [Solirubrobacterales bacterium]